MSDIDNPFDHGLCSCFFDEEKVCTMCEDTVIAPRDGAEDDEGGVLCNSCYEEEVRSGALVFTDVATGKRLTPEQVLDSF